MLKKFLNALGLGKSADLMSHSEAEFVVAARANLIAQNDAHATTWQLGKEQGWSADIGMGVIVFRFANGLSGTTHFQVVGTYDEIDGSFLWGWAHSSVPAAFREHASLAKQWGSENNHPAFLAKSVKCSLDDAMDFAAVANSLAGSKGVYRGHSGKKYIFMTLGDLHVESNLAAPHWAAMAKASQQ
ncbi:MAG: hypothetical protein V4447_02865 [Pseudomonadota bacterium]